MSDKDLRRPAGPRANPERRGVRVNEGAAARLHHVRVSLCGCTAPSAGEARRASHQASAFVRFSQGSRSASQPLWEVLLLSPSISSSRGRACHADTRLSGRERAGKERKWGATRGGEENFTCAGRSRGWVARVRRGPGAPQLGRPEPDRRRGGAGDSREAPGAP